MFAVPCKQLFRLHAKFSMHRVKQLYEKSNNKYLDALWELCLGGLVWFQVLCL